MANQSNHFQKARVKLILEHPFYAILALHLIEKEMDMKHPIIQQLVMPTCGVDGRNLYVNPTWVDKLKDDERIGLLAHEVLHVALSHVWPWRRAWREHKKWNTAGDYVINDMLKKDNFVLPAGGLYDKKYEGMSTEEVYEILEKEEKKSGKKQEPTWEDILDGMLGGEGGESGKESKDKDGNPIGKGLSTAEAEKLEQEWKERLVEAAQVAKMKGKLPAGIERLVDMVITPKVPWYSLLTQYVNDILRDDYNELIHDRRFIQQGIYLPDLYSEGADICVAVDTSGSIGPQEIEIFVSEVVGIMRSRNVKSVRVIACDAAVHMDTILNPWDPIPTDYPGGGGTDFNPIFDRIAEGCTRPAVCIVLTDTFGSFPENPPPYPVLWCGMTKDPEIPWGTYIEFDPNECGVSVTKM